MKDKLLWIALIAIVIIAGIYTYTSHSKATDVMEQQQDKIEWQQNKISVLQEENAYLHDAVANLSNDLMKINK